LGWYRFHHLSLGLRVSPSLKEEDFPTGDDTMVGAHDGE
jgi:hypothetical protein